MHSAIAEAFRSGCAPMFLRRTSLPSVRERFLFRPPEGAEAIREHGTLASHDCREPLSVIDCEGRVHWLLASYIERPSTHRHWAQLLF